MKRFWLILLIVSGVAHAQKLELGKVSVEELNEKVYAADTSAPAAIIFKKAESRFKYRRQSGFYMVHEYKYRIKIYKKEGLAWANFSVPYYTAYKEMNDDHIEFSDAVTYNLEGGKIVKTKTGSEGRFKKKLSEYWDEATLVMANVKVGSVIEFKYTMRTEDISEFPTFFFQEKIPVMNVSYNTIMPQYFQYKPVMIGFGNIVNNAKVVEESVNTQDEHNQSVRFNYQAVSRDFYGVDIPALKDEPYVDNIQNYRSAVKHELEKVKYPNDPEKLYSTTWEAVALDIYKNDKFGKELRERQYFETYLDPSIKAADSQMQRATNIFNFVQRTMAWDNKYGYLARKGVKKAFAEKSGNTADINLMLVAMLNHGGINAHPVLVSTIENGVAAFPNRANFNSVIASAEIDGKIILFDATSKNSAPGILPMRNLNWHGWRITNDGKATQIDLVPSAASKALYTVLAKVDAAGQLTGKAKISKTDYYGLGFREKYKNVNQDNYLDWLEAGMKGIEISGYTVDIPDDATQPVEEKFDFKGSSVEVVGDKIYIDPLLFLSDGKNPFTAESRVLPIYYGFPKLQKYNITIEIPEGYTIVSMPKSIALSTPQNVGAYKLNIQQNAGKIQLMVTNEIKMAIVSSDFYQTLRSYYDGMMKAETEKIVLAKI